MKTVTHWTYFHGLAVFTDVDRKIELLAEKHTKKKKASLIPIPMPATQTALWKIQVLASLRDSNSWDLPPLRAVLAVFTPFNIITQPDPLLGV